MRENWMQKSPRNYNLILRLYMAVNQYTYAYVNSGIFA